MGEARVSLVISTEEANATERRNLLYMQVGSQIPPLASLGRDDKRGRAARPIDKRGEAGRRGRRPLRAVDKRGASLALSKAPEEEGRNGVLWAEL